MIEWRSCDVCYVPFSCYLSSKCSSLLLGSSYYLLLSRTTSMFARCPKLKTGQTFKIYLLIARFFGSLFQTVRLFPDFSANLPVGAMDPLKLFS